jgi:hypothetical protein
VILEDAATDPKRIKLAVGAAMLSIFCIAR